MSSRYALLNPDHSIKFTEDCLEWGRWLETADRVVKQQVIGAYLVSTVFLGINHSFLEPECLWFETMIFETGASEVYCERCETWDEALKMHEVAVQWAKDRKV